jgi:hypothetical protein
MEKKMGSIKKKSDCPDFRPSVTNPEICAKWIKIPQKDPFCQVEEKCSSMGFRLTPRLDQESDSEE